MEIIKHGCFLRVLFLLLTTFMIVVYPLLCHNPSNLYKIRIEDEEVRRLYSSPSTDKVLRFYYDNDETCSISIKALGFFFSINVVCISFIFLTTASKLKYYTSRLEKFLPPPDQS